jgi:hypothetical protein
MPTIAKSLGYLPGGDFEMPKELLGMAVGEPLIHVGDEGPRGLVELGNINVYNENYLLNPKNKTLTEKPYVFEEKGAYTILPAMINGIPQTREQAIENYKGQGENFGRFKDVESADVYAGRVYNWARHGLTKPFAEQAVAKMPAPSQLPMGMIQRGNIDLDKAQVAKPMMAIYQDPHDPRLGQAVIFPGSIYGTQMNPEEAVKRYEVTGEHLGTFKDPVSATAWMDKLVQRPGMIEPTSIQGVSNPQAREAGTSGWPEFGSTYLSSQEASARAGRPIKSGTVLTDRNGNRIVVN